MNEKQKIDAEMASNKQQLDDFDWEGETQPTDSELNEAADMMVSAAVTVLERALPWAYAKREEFKHGKTRIYRVKQVCSEADMKWLEEQYPGYIFDFSGMVYHHDHPVSHISTILNEAEMVESNVLEGRKYVDIWGSVSRCASSTRPVVCAYEKNTPKDYLRYHKNVDNAVEIDWDQMMNGIGPYKGISEYTMTHSLYYMPLEKLARLLRLRNGRLRALVHRHPHTSGVLNNGELKYTVSEEGIVTQTNALTGESYVHRSVESLFHQTSCSTSEGGLSWTLTKAGGDSYFIEFVGCPNDICQGPIKPFKYLYETQTRKTLVCGVRVHKFMHLTWTWVRSSNVEKILHDNELLVKLRRYVGGKPRTPRVRTELGNYARRLTNKDDIISIHGDGCHDIDIADVTDYVTAAFYMDVAHELEVACEYARKNSGVVNALNKFYETGVVSRDLASLAQGAQEVIEFSGISALDPVPGHMALEENLHGLSSGFIPSFREGAILSSLGVEW